MGKKDRKRKPNHQLPPGRPTKKTFNFIRLSTINTHTNSDIDTPNPHTPNATPHTTTPTKVPCRDHFHDHDMGCDETSSHHNPNNEHDNTPALAPNHIILSIPSSNPSPHISAADFVC